MLIDWSCVISTSELVPSVPLLPSVLFIQVASPVPAIQPTTPTSFPGHPTQPGNEATTVQPPTTVEASKKASWKNYEYIKILTLSVCLWVTEVGCLGPGLTGDAWPLYFTTTSEPWTLWRYVGQLQGLEPSRMVKWVWSEGSSWSRLDRGAAA